MPGRRAIILSMTLGISCAKGSVTDRSQEIQRMENGLRDRNTPGLVPGERGHERYVPRDGVIVADGARAPLGSLANAFFSRRKKALDLTSGMRSFGKTAELILDGMDSDASHDDKSYESMRPYRAYHRSAVELIASAYEDLGQPAPTIGPMTPDVIRTRRERLRQRVEAILSAESEQGHPFSNHLTGGAYDFSIANFDYDDKVEFVNDALAAGATILIEGAESVRREAIRLRKESSAPSRVNFGETSQPQIHLDFSAIMGAGTGDVFNTSWLPSRFKIEIERAPSSTATIEAEKHDDGRWSLSESGGAVRRCISERPSADPGFLLACEDASGHRTTLLLPDFSQSEDVTELVRTGTSTTRLSGTIVEVRDAAGVIAE